MRKRPSVAKMIATLHGTEISDKSPVEQEEGCPRDCSSGPGRILPMVALNTERHAIPEGCATHCSEGGFKRVNIIIHIWYCQYLKFQHKLFGISYSPDFGTWIKFNNCRLPVCEVRTLAKADILSL